MKTKKISAKITTLLFSILAMICIQTSYAKVYDDLGKSRIVMGVLDESKQPLRLTSVGIDDKGGKYEILLSLRKSNPSDSIDLDDKGYMVTLRDSNNNDEELELEIDQETITYSSNCKNGRMDNLCIVTMLAKYDEDEKNDDTNYGYFTINLQYDLLTEEDSSETNTKYIEISGQIPEIKVKVDADNNLIIINNSPNKKPLRINKIISPSDYILPIKTDISGVPIKDTFAIEFGEHLSFPLK